MKVLIISTNTLPSAPSGPAYIAGAALEAGHTVDVFECLFENDPVPALENKITEFKPDVVGISIRLVHGYVRDEETDFGTRHLDLRVRIRDAVNCIKRVSNARIVLGGPGFNYYGPDWLEYLNLDYGIRGEGEITIPLYLKKIEEGGDIRNIPGCVFRDNGQFKTVPREPVKDLDATAFPAYELFDLDRYKAHSIFPALFTKRGCAFHCIYCPYSSLEGRYRLKSPQRVVREIERIYKYNTPEMVQFCDNNFNAPRKHAEAICKEIIDNKMDIAWGTSSLKPIGVSEHLLRLFKDSGCVRLNLSVETASKKMLKKLRRGGTAEQIETSLSNLSRAKIPFGISLMFGGPGETPETIWETLKLVDRYEIPLGVWVTIGICLWTPYQEMLDTARQHDQLLDDRELFEGATYMSPELPKAYMIELIEMLREKGQYTVQVNKPYAEYSVFS